MNEQTINKKTGQIQGSQMALFSNQKSLFGQIFGGSCNGRCRYMLWSFVLFCEHLAYLVGIWYILLAFGIFDDYLVYFSPVLVCCTTKNLATPAKSF
jgi:hypothetical protein